MTERGVTNLISRSLVGVEQDCSSIQLMTALDVHVTTTHQEGGGDSTDHVILISYSS